MTVDNNLVTERARAAMQLLFVGDALAMPVHWYYNLTDIERAFPGGVRGFAAAPKVHPSSIMSLHSTSQGGRGSQQAGTRREVVGDLILKGRRQFWGQPGMHYHQGMAAGDNTLNAHCARLIMRLLAAKDDPGAGYDQAQFLDEYIDFMTADPPRHNDTYAESFHRGFFANLAAGKAPKDCAAITHDTPSIGGLVMIAPLALGELLRGTDTPRVREQCLQHLALTHPDDSLARVAGHFVDLIEQLLQREPSIPAQSLIAKTASAIGVDLAGLCRSHRDDREVVGGRFSSACYISGSWPSSLYLAYRYHDRPIDALLANANLGGDSAHRGAIIGLLLGLASADPCQAWFDQLTAASEISREIGQVVDLLSQPSLENSL